MEELLRMRRGRELQEVGAASEKLRESYKHMHILGTANKLQSDERGLRVSDENSEWLETLGRMARERMFQMVGAASGYSKTTSTID